MDQAVPEGGPACHAHVVGEEIVSGAGPGAEWRQRSRWSGQDSGSIWLPPLARAQPRGASPSLRESMADGGGCRHHRRGLPRRSDPKLEDAMSPPHFFGVREVARVAARRRARSTSGRNAGPASFHSSSTRR